MPNVPLLGYSCEKCKAVYFTPPKNPDAAECQVCKEPVTPVELVNAVNKARLIYLAVWAGIAAICLGIAIPLVNPESTLGRVLLVLGAFGILLIVCYMGFACLRTALGLGGWRWLTKKTLPKQPPDWYHMPTLGQALIKESFVSIGIVIVFALLTLVRNIARG